MAVLLKKKLLLMTALVTSISTSSAFAGETVDFANEIQALKAQLASQQKLIQALEKKLSAQVESQQKDIAALKAAPVATAQSDVKITMKPSPRIESRSGDFSFQPFGRIHLDAGVFDDDKNDHPDGATFRRARLGFKGDIGSDINYKFELDFGNKGSNDSVSFKDVYVAYTGLDAFNIKAGSFKPAYGLEELTSSNYITFIERSLPTSSFATSEIIGLQAYDGGANYSWAVGIHNDKSTVKSRDDEAKSVVARATFAPIVEKDRLIHLGVSQAYRVPDSGSDSVAFDTQAENALQRLESVETGTISDVEHIHLTGIEAAGVYGPFSLQGEYFHNAISRESQPDVDVTGWYTQASYFVTGESRAYKAKKGLFSRVKPHQNFDLEKGTWGALELAARYSNLDLNDGPSTQGGEVNDLTLGANWYLTPNFRLMFNYIQSNTDSVVPSGSNVVSDDDPSIYLLRASIDF